jgi:hypothetical protein
MGAPPSFLISIRSSSSGCSPTISIRSMEITTEGSSPSLASRVAIRCMARHSSSSATRRSMRGDTSTRLDLRSSRTSLEARSVARCVRIGSSSSPTTKGPESRYFHRLHLGANSRRARWRLQRPHRFSQRPLPCDAALAGTWLRRLCRGAVHQRLLRESFAHASELGWFCRQLDDANSSALLLM